MVVVVTPLSSWRSFELSSCLSTSPEAATRQLVIVASTQGLLRRKVRPLPCSFKVSLHASDGTGGATENVVVEELHRIITGKKLFQLCFSRVRSMSISPKSLVSPGPRW